MTNSCGISFSDEVSGIKQKLLFIQSLAEHTYMSCMQKKSHLTLTLYLTVGIMWFDLK